MLEAVSTALNYPGAVWLGVAALVSGLVRGFSGFGTALVFLPAAAAFVPPLWALLLVFTMDLIGPLPMVPQTVKKAYPRDLKWLLGACFVVLPFALPLNYIIDPFIYRYGVSSMALIVVVCLVFGLRYNGRVERPQLIGTGAFAGLLGGITGLPGPVVILFYMARDLPISAIRANLFLFLFAFDIVGFGLIGLQGQWQMTPIILGLILGIPNLVGIMIGSWMFKFGSERMYRLIAYVVVLVSAIASLPLWD